MTLVELLVAITVSSVIMCGSGVLLHGMYRADKETRLGVAADASLARFALQFRRDAHASAEVMALSDAEGRTIGMAFQCPGQPAVEYRWLGTSIVRVTSESGQVIHRDAFRFRPGDRVTWQLPAAGSAIVAVQISQAPPRGTELDAIPRQRIEAAVGRLRAGRVAS